MVKFGASVQARVTLFLVPEMNPRTPLGARGSSPSEGFDEVPGGVFEPDLGPSP